MLKLITLAINETYPGTGHFAVIVAKIPEYELLSFALKRDDIIGPTGDIYWDIGRITIIDDIKKQTDNRGNVQFVPIGHIEFKPELYNQLKDDFDKKSKEFQTFIENNEEIFGIAKVKNLNGLIRVVDDGEINKFYIDASLCDINTLNFKRPLLNKDYRWVNYWNRICAKGEFEEKKQKYQNLLNRDGKDLYLIFYRHNFSNRPFHWIAGMHLL